MPNRFHKEERLSSKKRMEELFKKGKHFNSSPVKLICLMTEQEQVYPVQTMFVVPKRLFKRSNVRNTLKRRMRESYRLQKAELYTKLELSGTKWSLAFIYTGNEIADYKKIGSSVTKLLCKLD